MSVLIQQESSNCILAVSLEELSVTTLKLRYMFQNNTQNIIFIFNKFWSASMIGEKIEIMPNQLNIRVIDGQVLISQAMIPVPDDIEVEREYTPYQSKVAVQGLYEGLVELPLPLTPHTCYTMPWQQSPSKEVEKLPLYFEIGYIEVPHEIEDSFEALETAQGRVYNRSSPYQAQSILRTTAIVANVPVYTS